jgi:hypothetical protein
MAQGTILSKATANNFYPKIDVKKYTNRVKLSNVCFKLGGPTATQRKSNEKINKNEENPGKLKFFFLFKLLNAKN